MNHEERLAREYREALERADGETDVERIVALEENQLDAVNALLARAPLSGTERRTLSYVKNVTYRILQKLNALVKNEAYVPSFRTVTTPCSSLLSSLVNTQIGIYVLYDAGTLPYASLSEILSLENRKTALLGTL